MAVLHAKPNPTPPTPAQTELQRFLRLVVRVVVMLAVGRLMLSAVLRLGRGGFFEFFNSSDVPLEMLMNYMVIGMGVTV